MKFVRRLAVVGCIGLMATSSLIAAPAAAPAQTSHAAHPHSGAKLAPANRWTPDAPLREGMRRARAAVDALQTYESGGMTSRDAVAQAAELEAAVVYMFSNCKLAPEPDAALHGILVPLLSAAQALQADPGKPGAIVGMRVAIAKYPQYFNDPGWM